MNYDRQGKCTRCRARYVWRMRGSRGLPLYMAHCPYCGEKLKATNWMLQWPWLLSSPVNAVRGAELDRRVVAGKIKVVPSFGRPDRLMWKHAETTP